MSDAKGKPDESPQDDEGRRQPVPHDRAGKLRIPPPDLKRPRSGPHADAPGALALVVRSSARMLKPGDTLSVHCFATGYGEISAAKLFALTPIGVFDEHESEVSHSLSMEPVDDRGNMQFVHASQTDKFDDHDGPLIFLGAQYEGWSETTTFFDFDVLVSNRHQLPSQTLVTEHNLARPPVLYSMRLAKDAPAGDHDLQFALSYFNGAEWLVSQERVSFHVTSWLERNQTWMTIVGVLLALLALFLQVYQGWAP